MNVSGQEQTKIPTLKLSDGGNLRRNKLSYYETALDRATEIFGDEDRAVRWLNKMSGTFSMSPKEILSDQDGLDRVLRHLRSVELAIDTD